MPAAYFQFGRKPKGGVIVLWRIVGNPAWSARKPAFYKYETTLIVVNGTYILHKTLHGSNFAPRGVVKT